MVYQRITIKGSHCKWLPFFVCGQLRPQPPLPLLPEPRDLHGWDGSIQTVGLSPEHLADKAAELNPHGNIGVADTYNEPLVGYEHVRDRAYRLAEEARNQLPYVYAGNR